MADNKVKMSEFGILPEPEIKHVPIGGAVVTMKNQIPYEEVYDLIQWVIDLVVDDRAFISEIAKRIVIDFGLVKFYTNVDVEHFMPSDYDIHQVYEDYDILMNSGLLPILKDFINKEQYDFFVDVLDKTIKNLIDYRNSAQGIVDALGARATDQKEAMESAIATFDNPKNMEKVKEVMALVDELNLNK